MANAEEEEEENEEEERNNRYKKDDKAANSSGSSGNQVTVNKDLMKQLEESVYNRVVSFLKAAPTG